MHAPTLSPVILSADCFDLVELFVEVTQARHGALRDEENPGLGVSLLQEYLQNSASEKLSDFAPLNPAST